MPCPCRAHAVLMSFSCRSHVVFLPCHAALIHICHAAPLPRSDNAVSFVKVRVVAGNIRTAGLNNLTDRLFVVCCYHTLQS